MQNDHGPPPGTRDRPSDTGSAARLAARPATEIMLFRPVDVQCTSRRLRLANPNPEWHLQAAKQAASGSAPARRAGDLPRRGSGSCESRLRTHSEARTGREAGRSGICPRPQGGDLPRRGSGSCESRLRTHSEGRTGREAGRICPARRAGICPQRGSGSCESRLHPLGRPHRPRSRPGICPRPRAGLPRRGSAPADPRFAENYSALRYFSFSHSETWMRYSSHSRRLSSM